MYSGYFQQVKGSRFQEKFYRTSFLIRDIYFTMKLNDAFRRVVCINNFHQQEKLCNTCAVPCLEKRDRNHLSRLVIPSVLKKSTYKGNTETVTSRLLSRSGSHINSSLMFCNMRLFL